MEHYLTMAVFSFKFKEHSSDSINALQKLYFSNVINSEQQQAGNAVIFRWKRSMQGNARLNTRAQKYFH